MDNYLWKVVRNDSDGLKIINNNGELVMYCNISSDTELQRIVDEHNHVVLAISKKFIKTFGIDKRYVNVKW